MYESSKICLKQSCQLFFSRNLNLAKLFNTTKYLHLNLPTLTYNLGKDRTSYISICNTFFLIHFITLHSSYLPYELRLNETLLFSKAVRATDVETGIISDTTLWVWTDTLEIRMYLPTMFYLLGERWEARDAVQGI